MFRLLALSFALLPVAAMAQDASSPPVIPVALKDTAQIAAPPVPAQSSRDTAGSLASSPQSAPLPPAAAPTVKHPTSRRSSTAAILPFTGNLPAADLSAITSRFEGEMVAQDSFWILERRRMDQILKEQGFQQSGACDSSNCQVEVGQLLGVQKLFLGEVSRVGGLLTLTVRRVDVGTGRSETSHSLDIRGNVEDVLRLACREMALIASGVKSPDGDRSVLVAEKKNTLWPWLVGGAVVVGGGVTAAVLLSQGKSSSSASTSSETSVWVGW